MVAAGKHLDWTDFCLIPLSVAGSGLLLNTLSTIVPHLQVAAAEEHARRGWEAAARIPELEGQAGEVPLYCEKLKEAAAVCTVALGCKRGAPVLSKVRGVGRLLVVLLQLLLLRSAAKSNTGNAAAVTQPTRPPSPSCTATAGAVAIAAAVCLTSRHPG